MNNFRSIHLLDSTRMIRFHYHGRAFDIKVVEHDIDKTVAYSVYVNDTDLVRLIGLYSFLIWEDKMGVLRYTSNYRIPESVLIKEAIKEEILKEPQHSSSLTDSENHRNR